MTNLTRIHFLCLLFLMLNLGFKALAINVDSLEQVALTAQHDTTKIKALIKLSDHYQTSSTDRAYQYLLDARQICDEHDLDDPMYRQKLGLVLMSMGTIEIRFLGKTEDAQKHLKQAKEAFAGTGDFRHLAGVQMMLGIVQYYNGAYPEALVYHKKAVRNYKISKYPYGLGGAYNNMGMTYVKLGRLETAIEAYRNSMMINDSIGASIQTAQAANNIGALYNDLEEYDLARVYFNKTLSIRKVFNDSFELGSVYTNLGASYRHSNDFDSALWNCKQAILHYEATGHPELTINPTNNIGLIYMDQMELEKAKSQFELAVALARTYDQPAQLSLSLANLAVLSLYSKDYQTAINLSMEALEIAEDLNLARHKLQIFDNLQKAYQNTGNLEKAIAYKDAWHAIKDSLTSIKNKEIITRLESEYLAEQQRAEIEFHQAALQEQRTLAQAQQSQMIALIIIIVLMLLSIGLIYRAYVLKTSKNKALSALNERIQEQNQKIEEQSRHLQKLNQHKDKLFSLVAHDLRGPFASVKSLLELMKDEENPQLSTHLKENFQHVYGLLENLLEWSRSQLDGLEINKETINVSQVIDETLSLYQKPLKEKEISTNVDVAPNLNLEADRNMILVSIRNLLSNAIKFSKRHGMISIEANKKADTIAISFTDDGVGMKENQVSRILTGQGLSTSGTENENGTGLGIALCKEFIAAHGGELTCVSTPDKGTKMSVRFPINAKEFVEA